MIKFNYKTKLKPTIFDHITQNKAKFNNLITTNILATAEAVATAFKGQNKSEKVFIDALDKLLT